MARLTTSSGSEKKGEFAHPLAMPLNAHDSHPLESSNRPETKNGAPSGERSVLINKVALKDNGVLSSGNEVESKPQQNYETKQMQKSVQQDSSLPIHATSSNFQAKHRQLSQLPRSVRWRLSLGVLTDPFDGEDVKDDTGDNKSEKSSGSNSKPSCIQQMLEQDKVKDNILSQLKTIEEVNALKLRFQRSRYEELEKRHYWSHTPVGIAGKTDNKAAEDVNKAEVATTTTQHVAKGDDPLSAFLETGQEDKGIFGFGAKRKGKRGNAINNNSVHSTSTKSTTTKSTKSSNEKEPHPSPNHNSKEEEEKRDKSKWASFYSNREMLDVIEKDLNRLPTDHYTMYHSWRKQCKQCREEMSSSTNKSNIAEDVLRGSDIEGATQPQKQTNVSLRKRFANTGLGQSLNLGRDRKLLATLEDDEEEDEGKKAEAVERLEIETSTKERAQMLSQILFVYGQEHEDIGYRQGMHEILSYILLALEIDLMELAVAKEKKKLISSIEGNEDDDNNGGMAGVDSSGNIVVVRLLDPDFILHDAFTLFECIMDALASAYDVVEGVDGNSAGCLEAMTSSIVSKIRYIARDEALFSHVLYMPVPPQLYFAKWVRLMFGREVAGGMHAVMELWDAFFELASATASMDECISLSNALMNVLKTAAAAMILLIRHLLLAPTVAWDGSLTGDPDPNDGIQYLMNYPPIEDTGVFVKTVTSLLAKEKLLIAKSSQKEGPDQRVKARRYQRMSSNEPIVAIEKQPAQSQNDEEDELSHSSSNGGFMGWPSESGENKLNLPEMYRSSMTDEELEKNKGQDHKPDISETLGNFASGLMGLASRSVDAAASLTTQKQQPRRPSRKGSFSRLSFTGRRDISGNDNDHDNDQDSPKESKEHDFIIDTCRPDEEGSDYIQVIEADINDDANKKSRGPIRRRSMSNESALSDASCTTFSSRLTASRSLSESCRQDPVALAKKLERSVATLMKHFHEQMRAQADVLQDNNSGIPPPLCQTLMIPEEIWHAMADIDQVRKDLLSQSATEKLDRSSSCASLLGMERKNE